MSTNSIYHSIHKTPLKIRSFFFLFFYNKTHIFYGFVQVGSRKTNETVIKEEEQLQSQA